MPVPKRDTKPPQRRGRPERRGAIARLIERGHEGLRREVGDDRKAWAARHLDELRASTRKALAIARAREAAAEAIAEIASDDPDRAVLEAALECMPEAKRIAYRCTRAGKSLAFRWTMEWETVDASAEPDVDGEWLDFASHVLTNTELADVYHSGSKNKELVNRTLVKRSRARRTRS